MPKKREVASLVGNFSPVKRSRAILVSRMRHFRGDTGEVLKTRAVSLHQYCRRMLLLGLGEADLPERHSFCRL